MTPTNPSLHTINISTIPDDSHHYHPARTELMRAIEAAGYQPHDDMYRQGLSLLDVEQQVVAQSDGFVFLPIPSSAGLNRVELDQLFHEFFKVSSLIVGKMTEDPLLSIHAGDRYIAKPIIILNKDGSWDDMQALLNHLHMLGTVSQKPKDLVTLVHSEHQVVKALHLSARFGVKDVWNHCQMPVNSHPIEEELQGKTITTGREHHGFKVCVFCSASTRNPMLLQAASLLGEQIAAKDWGLVTGAGSRSMMGAVVGAANWTQRERGTGWTAGCNIDRIIAREGTPQFMDQFWPADDIYSRMDIMIRESHAFIIMPGGMGTVQELMAILLLKHNSLTLDADDHPMRGKPIVVVNERIHDHTGNEVRFWDPLIRIIRRYGFENEIHVVDSAGEAVPALERIAAGQIQQLAQQGKKPKLKVITQES